MSNTISAIPTTYNGVRFRSRLEAKWASFFDLLGWKWQYEPIDLNGYIPDFVLEFHKPFIVEVKPALEFEELECFADKIEKSGWNHEAIIVGSQWWEGNCEGNYHIGLLSQRMDVTEENADGLMREPGEYWDWDQGDLIRCAECGKPGIYHPIQSWYDYNCGGGHKVYGEFPEAVDLWKQAGNIVQWKAR